MLAAEMHSRVEELCQGCSNVLQTEEKNSLEKLHMLRGLTQRIGINYTAIYRSQRGNE